MIFPAPHRDFCGGGAEALQREAAELLAGPVEPVGHVRDGNAEALGEIPGHLEMLLLIVADRDNTLILSGSGDIIEPDDGIVAIGSGGPYALAAAKALTKHSDLSAAAEQMPTRPLNTMS